MRRVEKIETAVEPRFQEHFVEAMAIPHRTAPSPHLERVVTLPAATGDAPIAAPTRGAERRRRRAVAADALAAHRRRPMTETLPTRRSGGREAPSRRPARTPSWSGRRS